MAAVAHPGEELRAGRGAALAVLVVAVNLRGAVVAVSPVLDEIRADTGLSAAGAGLLTTLPVLCFGVFALVTPWFGRRFGIERTITAALALLAAAVLLRLAPGLGPLFAGTLLLGAAIAVSNVMLPALIKRDFPARAGLLTGAYITVMGIGATLAAGGTVPLEEATGIGWRPAIAVWAVPAGLALGVTWRRARRGRDAGGAPVVSGGVVRGLWGDRVAWLVTGFMGLQSLSFYATLAWLPTIFADSGLPASRAGLLLAVGSLVSLPASLLAPALAARHRDQRPALAASVGLIAAGLTGLVLAPAALPALWMVLLGLGQGASIALALTMVSLRAPDSRHAGQLSSMVQGVGYVLAAAGPIALGAIHEATGEWTVPLAVLLLLTGPQLALGLGAGRDRLVRTHVE